MEEKHCELRVHSELDSQICDSLFMFSETHHLPFSLVKFSCFLDDSL